MKAPHFNRAPAEEKPSIDHDSLDAAERLRPPIIVSCLRRIG
jgi:hypothetical protein